MCHGGTATGTFQFSSKNLNFLDENTTKAKFKVNATRVCYNSIKITNEVDFTVFLLLWTRHYITPLCKSITKQRPSLLFSINFPIWWIEFSLAFKWRRIWHTWLHSVLRLLSLTPKFNIKIQFSFHNYGRMLLMALFLKWSITHHLHIQLRRNYFPLFVHCYHQYVSQRRWPILIEYSFYLSGNRHSKHLT